VLDYEYYFKLTNYLLEGDMTQSLLVFNEILNRGFDGQHFITGLSSHFRDLMICKDPSTLVLLEVGAGIRDQYQKQAEDCPLEFLYAGLRIFNQCDLDYKESKNKRLLVELALIRTSQLMDSKKKIIELVDEIPDVILPINNQNSQTIQTQPVQPQVTQSQVAQSQVAQPQVVNKTEQKPVVPGKLSSYSSIRTIRKIKDVKETETADIPVKKEVVIEMERPYEYSDVIDAWNEFSKGIENDIHLTNAFNASRPEKISEHNFEIAVSNQVLFEKMYDTKPKVEAYIRNKVKNSKITLSIKIVENQTSFRPFTSREKLEAMVKKNPDILLLYRTFGLDIM
jgi:DNA polymerase-3 subunit gamma/tau